jgi:LysM repeat protein
MGIMNIKSSCFIFLFLSALAFGGYAQGTSNAEVHEINGKRYLFHQVEKGNTLYSLSREYNVSVESIVSENPSAKAGLNVGQVLRILLPDEKDELKRNIELDGNYLVHEVTAKQTLYAIAHMYNVDVRDIAAENQNVVYGLKEGDVLKIPINKMKKPTPPGFDPTKDRYVDHRVEPKETLFSLSRYYNVSISAIQEVNNGLPEGLKEGEIINIPIINETNDSLMHVKAMDSIVLKSQYRIALMLPLYLDMNDSLSSNRVPGEEFSLYGDKNTAAAFKFYQGVEMALDSMGKLGFKATLYLYDTENDTAKISAILKKSEFTDMDLIIGPLYPNLFAQVLQFANKNNINIVSPIDPSNRPLLGNKVLIKLVTSKTTQVINLAKYIADNYRNQNVVVFRKDLGRDDLAETFLTYYREYIEIIEDTSIYASASPFVCNSSTKTELFTQVLKKDVPNLVFIPSLDKVFVTNMIRKLVTLSKNYPITVVGTDDWLKYDNIDIDYFNQLNLHVITWSHIDYEAPRTLRFVKAYESRFGSFPGDYANRAFDASLYLFGMMNTYGNQFPYFMEKVPGKMSAHDFRFCQTGIESGFENQSLVILKYKDFKLVRLN